jgi:hypothetical protein
MASENVLGVVGCTVLLDELSHVLSQDSDLGRVCIIDNEGGRLLHQKLSERGVGSELLLPGELEQTAFSERFSVLAIINPAGPHDNQSELRGLVKEAAVKIAPYSGLCLCFYGLCRNALWKIDRLGEEVGAPMMILTDTEGKEVDDCFGANIGGKKAYLDAIVHHRGTIFVSPGYAENWQRRQSQKDFPKMIEQVENMRFVFERMGYRTVMKLENGLGDQERFNERVSGFAKIFDMSVASKECGLTVFEHSYALAKSKLLERQVRP